MGKASVRIPAKGFRYQANPHQKKNSAICSRVAPISFLRRNWIGSRPRTCGCGIVDAKMPKIMTRARWVRLRPSTFVWEVSEAAASAISLHYSRNPIAQRIQALFQGPRPGDHYPRHGRTNSQSSDRQYTESAV